MKINYCTVCGGELSIPVSEEKEQHKCPTCGVEMTTFIDRKRIKGEDVLSVVIDRESLKHLNPGYENIGRAWLGEGESDETK